MKGQTERSTVQVGDAVELFGYKDTMTSTCQGVDKFRKPIDAGPEGEDVGLLLKDIKREEIESVQVVAKPSSGKPYRKFECEVYMPTKEEGGRGSPFFSIYRPQFHFHVADVVGSIELPEGKEMVFPGDNFKLVVSLMYHMALETGLRFAVHEGGKTVGIGVVAKIIA